MNLELNKVLKTIACVFLCVFFFMGCKNFGQKEINLDEARDMLNHETAMYIAHQKITSNASKQVEGTIESIKTFFGNREILLPVEANFKYTIVFSEIDDIKIDGRTITLTLPRTHLELDNYNVLWDEVRENVGLLRSSFSQKEKDEIVAVAKEELKTKACENTKYIDATNRIAKEQLNKLFGNLGYDVVVNYSISLPIINN